MLLQRDPLPYQWVSPPGHCLNHPSILFFFFFFLSQRSRFPGDSPSLGRFTISLQNAEEVLIQCHGSRHQGQRSWGDAGGLPAPLKSFLAKSKQEILFPLPQYLAFSPLCPIANTQLKYIFRLDSKLRDKAKVKGNCGWIGFYLLLVQDNEISPFL